FRIISFRKTDQPCISGYIKPGIINGEGTVTEISFCKQRPSLTVLAHAPKIKARLFQRIVVLHAGIYDPSYAVQFKYKTSGIHVSVTEGCPAAFAGKIIMIGIVFPVTEYNDWIGSVSLPCQRKAHFL